MIECVGKSRISSAQSLSFLRFISLLHDALSGGEKKQLFNQYPERILVISAAQTPLVSPDGFWATVLCHYFICDICYSHVSLGRGNIPSAANLAVFVMMLQTGTSFCESVQREKV